MMLKRFKEERNREEVKGEGETFTLPRISLPPQGILRLASASSGDYRRSGPTSAAMTVSTGFYKNESFGVVRDKMSETMSRGKTRNKAVKFLPSID